jgi:hypothetical protein
MTRSWKRVVELLEAGQDPWAIASAAQVAAEGGLKEIKRDPALIHALWLLTQLPGAARAEDYAAALRGHGLAVSDAPSLMELVGAFSDAVDARVRADGGRTDLGEMAQLSAAETLTTVVGDRLPSLFGTTPADVQRELAALGTSKQFGGLLQDFFARLTYRHLAYYLNRVAPDQVSGNGRFQDITEHQSFNDALRQHCREASRIVEDFAGGWYSKTGWDHRETGITQADVGAFAHVAVKKVGAELRRRSEEP